MARYAPTSSLLTQLFDCDQNASVTPFEKCLNRAAAISIRYRQVATLWMRTGCGMTSNQVEPDGRVLRATKAAGSRSGYVKNVQRVACRAKMRLSHQRGVNYSTRQYILVQWCKSLDCRRGVGNRGLQVDEVLFI